MSICFMNPRPSYKSIQEFYSTYQKYDNWLDNLESREKMWKRRLSKILKLHKMGRLLDIGTGIGQFLAVARTYYPEACGTEISDSAIQIASNRYSLLVYRGTLETIKFKENSFDIITIFHVLEHLHQPNQAIQEIWRILKPEGILIIAVPNEIMSLKRIIKKIFGYLGIKLNKNQGPSGLNEIDWNLTESEIHISFFTPLSLKKYLSDRGFEIIDISLDPYFATKNLKQVIDDIYYKINVVFHFLTGINVYDTIWISAKNDD